MERNINKGHCLVCGCVVPSGMGYRREVRGRGKRVFCSGHALGLEHYHGSSAHRADHIGTTKKMPLTRQMVGVEIEIDCDRNDETYLRFRGTLERVGYCFESDCTVRGGEAPSPKMQGLAHISKVLQNNEDMFYAFTENTGAHVHTSTSKIDYIRDNYHKLFLPLDYYLENHSDEWLVEKFGSSFRGYAETIDTYSDPEQHENFVNVQHEHTIEFRLPRIRERHQFMNVLKFWREVGFYLENEVINYRTAEKVGKEIVNIAQRYFGA